MNTKCILLTFSFFILGFVQVFAEQPGSTNFKPPRNAPSVNEDGSTKVSDFKSDEKELSAYEFCSSDSSLGEGFYPFLTIRPNYSLDSSNLVEVMKYLKRIIPVANEIGDQGSDMIEVL